MEQSNWRASDTIGFCTILDVRKNPQKLAMLRLPSIGLGFFLGNCLNIMSILVLECSIILGIFLEGHCAEK